MTTSGKAVINIATGLGDPDRVTVAFPVAGSAAQASMKVTMFLTNEAVRLALPHVAQGIACDSCPTLPTFKAPYADAGGRKLACPICFGARKLSEDELIDGAQLGIRAQVKSGTTPEGRNPKSSRGSAAPGRTLTANYHGAGGWGC